MESLIRHSLEMHKKTDKLDSPKGITIIQGKFYFICLLLSNYVKYRLPKKIEI